MTDRDNLETGVDRWCGGGEFFRVHKKQDMTDSSQIFFLFFFFFVPFLPFLLVKRDMWRDGDKEL